MVMYVRGSGSLNLPHGGQAGLRQNGRRLLDRSHARGSSLPSWQWLWIVRNLMYLADVQIHSAATVNLRLGRCRCSVYSDPQLT
eukprot:1586194-Pleurochrysis_carterae.AAC.4